MQTTAKQVHQGLQKTLTWNQRSALSYFLSMEDHMLQLTEDEIPHSWCLVKHYLVSCDHHVREAISHRERLGLDSSKYRAFHNKLMNLDVYPNPNITIPEIVDLRTEWRYIIEDPTLTADCPLCDSDITPKIKKLIEKHKTDLDTHRHTPNDFLQMEKDMAEKLIATICKEHGVEPPELIIVDNCKEPSMRAAYFAHDPGKIYGCKTGLDLHKIAHEVGHHIQKIGGKHLKEEEAEDFALNYFNNPQKGLYKQHTTKYNRYRMDDWKDVGKIYGVQFIGDAVSNLINQLNTTYPAGFFGQPTGLWLDLLAALGGYYGAMNFNDPYDLWAAIIGGYQVPELLKYVMPMVTPGVRTAPTTVVATVPTTQVRYTTQNGIAVKPVPLYNGKYQVVA